MNQIETPLDFLRKDVRKMKPLSIVCALAAFVGVTSSPAFISRANSLHSVANRADYPWVCQILQAAFNLSATLAVAIEKSRFKKLASFLGIGIIASNIVGVAVAIYLKRDYCGREQRCLHRRICFPYDLCTWY